LGALLDTKEKDREGFKLKELGVVFEQLEKSLAGRLIDPDNYLDLLAGQIPAAGFLKHCRVWVDGFISFTPQEWEVLKSLLDVSAAVVVTLCLDRQAVEQCLPDHHPFIKPRETYRRLHRLAAEKGIVVQEEFLAPELNPRFKEAPELQHLEKYFFRYPAVSYRGACERIKVVAGVDLRAEVEGVARCIRRLLRDDGLRLRQVMVLVRDVEAYFPLFRRVLDAYEIPYFIDYRRPVMHHPLVELLRSALEVWQSNWIYDAVFRYLKSGLTRVEREQVDWLENYVLASGIRGSSWYGEQPWRYMPGRAWWEEEAGDDNLPPELQQINDIRWKSIAQLRAAQLKYQKNASGRPKRLAGQEWARILLELCLELDVPGKLERWSRDAVEAGEPELAREHRQIWKLVCGLMDEMVEILGETELTVSEVAAVIDAGLEAVSFSHIPPGPDAVIVGSLERSLPPGDIEALFVAGLSERVLPANVRKYGLFTEKEKEQFSLRLAGLNLEVPPGVDDRLHHEQFLVYRVLTRTGGRLWLSYPLGDEEGRAVTRSPVIGRVRELFPGLNTGFWPAEPRGDETDMEFAEHPAGLLPRLPLRWQEAAWGYPVPPLWWQVYNLLVGSEVWRPRVGLLADGFTRRNMELPLGKELGLKIFGREKKRSKVITGNTSSLERFIKCPFSHFLAHGLGLRERPVHRLAPPDTGQLYHEALRRFVEHVSLKGPGWDQLTGDDISGICRGVMDELASRLQGGILLSSSRLRRQKESLLERLTDSARALVRQVTAGKLTPAALEVYFGPAGKGHVQESGGGRGGAFFCGELSLPPLELDLGGGVSLSLSGRIDRVDTGREQNRLFISVIDYKSGAEKLDLVKVLAGAQLQLMVYLWVALEYFTAVCGPGRINPEPAGAFYFRVHRPVIGVENPDLSPEDREIKWLEQFKLSGWLVDHGPEMVQLFDRNLKPGLASVIVPAALKKDGGVSGRQKATTYTSAEFKYLLNVTRKVLAQAGKHILAGRVDIAPFKWGKDSACSYCPYGRVCRFDLWLPENRYRSLTGDARDLRRRLEQEAQGKGESDLVLYKLV